MSHRVVSTSGKIELKTRYFLQNKTFLSQSRRCITNAPPVLSQVLSKLLVGYFVKISMGHFYIFSVGLDVNLQKRDRSWKQRVEKNWTGSTVHARNNNQRVELICRVLICNLLGFVQISVEQNDFEGSSCSLLLFACTVTVSAVEDNFQGENGEKFSQQNGPSYTYEINK